MKIRSIILRSSFLNTLVCLFLGSRFPLLPKGASIFRLNQTLLARTQVRLKGDGCKILLGKNTKLIGCKVSINGNANQILIGDNVIMDGVILRIWTDNNRIIIGHNTTINSGTMITACEGTTITIGDESMISYGCNIRSSDGHAIYSSKTRINNADNIKIGEHVWIGANATILKGVTINNNSVLGANTLVSSKEIGANSIWLGNPGKKYKDGIRWERDL